jgi:NAD(P)-dependent dehydrogenase (short-subunit alcohol dehydrogenase family)
MHDMLHGKRILITQADAFMGPALCEVFREQGAEVVASTADLAPVHAAEQGLGGKGTSPADNIPSLCYTLYRVVYILPYKGVDDDNNNHPGFVANAA